MTGFAVRPWLSPAAAIAAAVLVTAQAFSAPEKPHKARDLVTIPPVIQGALVDICRMYPADCHFGPDGAVVRVNGRRIVPGADRAVLNHFRTEIAPVQDATWGEPR